MTNEQKQSYTLRISQANKSGLVVILYEMFEDYVKEAKVSLQAGDRQALKLSLNKARGCVNELMESLHPEYEIAQNLLQLYLYVYRELLKCEMRKDDVHLENALKVMVPLKETYAAVSADDDSPAVMSNAQTVVAGLTYGRNDLNESMADQGASRGFYV
ncbi:MAG: flagellar protein FliS [Lachnospiraceae bacterium]|nr:flagellar protein FliS [Lachnospiraceae bacterium]